MPTGMFGAPTGISTAEADIRAQQMHELALGEGKVKLEQAQITLASQKQMMELMQQAVQAQPNGAATASISGQQIQQIAGGTSDKLASAMDLMANLSMQSGMLEKAKDFAVAGSTIRHNSATIQKDHTASMITELNFLGSLMDNVHDEASWRQANAMYEMQMGKKNPYAQLPYNPTVVSEIRQGALNAKDRALEAAAKAREKASDAVEAERRARVPLIQAQTRLANERTTALQKTGAINKVPKAGDVKAITDLLVKDFGAGILPEDARVMARPVAERMMDIMKSQGLPQSQAAMKAYQEAKDAGDFGGIRPRVAMGGSAQKPLDLPPSKDKLKPNMYYKGQGKHAGTTFLWTGAAFVPVGQGAGEVSTDEEDDETDTDDEGDEGVTQPDDYVGAQ